MSGVTPPLTPFSLFLDRLTKKQTLASSSFRQLTIDTTYLIAPPTSCPRFLDTIQRAKYLPRAPEGARVMMAPASATYQQPVPIPPIAPLRIRYCVEWLWSASCTSGSLEAKHEYSPTDCHTYCYSNRPNPGWETTWIQ